MPSSTRCSSGEPLANRRSVARRAGYERRAASNGASDLRFPVMTYARTPLSRLTAAVSSSRPVAIACSARSAVRPAERWRSMASMRTRKAAASTVAKAALMTSVRAERLVFSTSPGSPRRRETTRRRSRSASRSVTRGPLTETTRAEPLVRGPFGSSPAGEGGADASGGVPYAPWSSLFRGSAPRLIGDATSKRYRRASGNPHKISQFADESLATMDSDVHASRPRHRASRLAAAERAAAPVAVEARRRGDRRHRRGRRQALAEARVGPASPVPGTVGAAACLIPWALGGSDMFRGLAFIGFFLNLF